MEIKDLRNFEQTIKRGDIWMADLDVYNNDKIKRTQKFERPIIITSNNLCNQNSPTITLIPLTSRSKKKLPTHVILNMIDGVAQDSTAMAECIVTLDKSVLLYKVGECTEEIMQQIDKAITIQNSLNRPFNLNHALKLVGSITDLDKFTKKYNIDLDEDDKRLKDTLIAELKSYCNQYNINMEKLYRNNNININSSLAI